MTWMDTATPERSTRSTITDLVDELVIALINCKIYWSEHPRVEESVRELQRLLPTFTRGTDDKLRLAVTADHFVYQQRPLLGASLSAPRLIHAILDRGAGGIEIDDGASENDFYGFLALLSLNLPESEQFTAVNRRLADRGCTRIRLLPPYRPEQGKSGLRSLSSSRHATPDDRSSLTQIPIELYQDVVHVLQDTTISVCHGGLVKFDDARASVEQILHNLEHSAASLFGLSRYERYDAFTFGHSIRVALLALQLARQLTTDRDLLTRVGVAALLHDVGKAHVPFEVLHCKTRLSAEQRLEMQKHPVYGAEILLDHRDCDPMAWAAAFGHHVSSANRGYPNTVHQHRLSVVTRIVKICDVYEALTAVRPYKPAMSSVRAFRIMLSMHDAFDPALLRRFIATIGAYPTGTFVRVSTGEVARVRDQTARLERPIVELLATGGGELLGEADRRSIDLSHPGERSLRITEALIDAKLEDFAAQAAAYSGAKQ